MTDCYGFCGHVVKNLSSRVVMLHVTPVWSLDVMERRIWTVLLIRAEPRWLIASQWRGSGHENFILLLVSFFMSCNNMCAERCGAEFRTRSMSVPSVKQASGRESVGILLSFGMYHLMPAGNLTMLTTVSSCQQNCITYTIAVGTVKNHWWWTEELSETCRVSFQKWIWKIVH
jgi:hypothetical protein